MVLIINPYAGGGRALKKWKVIEKVIKNKLDSFEKIYLMPDIDLKARLMWNRAKSRSLLGGIMVSPCQSCL